MPSSRTSVGIGLGVGIFVLTLATAGIHLYLGLIWGAKLFLLNGLGYLGLLALLQLPIPQLARFRSAARWALIAFAALTIVLYFIIAPQYTLIGYADKAIEVALIALLLADAYTGSSKTSGEKEGTVS
jgi:hypothetical protein